MTAWLLQRMPYQVHVVTTMPKVAAGQEAAGQEGAGQEGVGQEAGAAALALAAAFRACL